METPKFCSNCQAPLTADAPRGLCPACLMKVALATATGATPEKPELLPPTIDELGPKFPQLEIIALLGRGGMGVVYKARQRELDRIVALKILPAGIGDDPAFAERFTREARALAKLNHPGIVTIHDFGRADGMYFFVMEYVDGVNLRQLLAGGRVGCREALAIVPAICDALQYAHDLGIVHRDIKPENILLDRRGRVKVADFGLAKIMAKDTSPGGPGCTVILKNDSTASVPSEGGKVLGTPAYMAPEQLEHPDEVDHRADIYALGVVFYQMLTGELPGRQIEPPSKRIQMDVRLDEVVLRALESQPDLRYQQVSEVKTRVETIASTLPSASSPYPKPEVLTTNIKLAEPSTFLPPAGPVELKLKWAPGARLVEEMDVLQNMAIHKPGQPDPLKQDLSMGYQHGFTVLNETPGGEHEVELEIISARIGMVTGSYQWHYDSTRSSCADSSQVAELFGKIVGSKIRYFLNSRNEVDRMEGAEELIRRVTFGTGAKAKAGMDWSKKGLDDVLKRIATGAQQPDQFAWLRGMFSEAYLEAKIRHYCLPTHAVQPGETWPVHHEYPIGVAPFLEKVLVRDFKITFRGWEAHGNRLCARLQFEGTEHTQKVNSNAAVIATPSTKGSYSGVSWFDPVLGRVLETISTRNFEVSSIKPVNPIASPAALGPLEPTTDYHHQVITEKLVSMEAGSS